MPLKLPLSDDVKWTVIDCLRGTWPAGAICHELFVRHNTPFDTFGDAGNLTNALSKRAQVRDHIQKRKPLCAGEHSGLP